MSSDSDTSSELISEILRMISVRSEYYSHGFIKLVLHKKNDMYKINSGLVSLLQKDETIIEETRDYGDFILITELFSPDQLNNLLKELGEKQSISLKNGLSLEAKGRFQLYRFIPSQGRLGWLQFTWPRGYVEYSLTDRGLPMPTEPLAKPGLPLYPDGRKAIADFFDLRIVNLFNSILIQIPDYRVRIEKLIISEKSVRLNIDCNIESDNLIAKFYADFEEPGFHSMHSPDLNFKENDVEFSFDKEFTYVMGVVMERETGCILDYLGYSFIWGPEEGVTIEYQEPEIREIIRRGENLRVELKQNLDSPNRILETIVAFANTKGGRIFIGVADDTNIIGTEPENKDRITNLITGNLDPVPEFNVNIIEINEKPIIIVEVPEGDSKPYSHRERGIFVRSASSTRSATRADTDRIYEEKRSGQPLYGL